MAFDRRGEGVGDPLSSDCRARHVPSRPLLAGYAASDGGGVASRRLGVERDDRRTSHGIADGRSMVRVMRDVGDLKLRVGKR